MYGKTEVYRENAKIYNEIEGPYKEESSSALDKVLQEYAQETEKFYNLINVLTDIGHKLQDTSNVEEKQVESEPSPPGKLYKFLQLNQKLYNGNERLKKQLEKLSQLI